MTWEIDLPRTGNNKTHYTREIRTLNTALVTADPELANVLASSNVSFASFVASIRKICEIAYPDPRSRPRHVSQLMTNTN